MKLIGITPLYDDKMDSYWMLPNYMKMIENLGHTAVMLPLTTNCKELDKLISLCDGFIISGGQDISPSMYNEKKSPLCGDECIKRDEMDSYILAKAIENDIPVLGICRGLQLINTHLNGTLYQDLEFEFSDSTSHQMIKPYDRKWHNVKIVKNSLLYSILNKEEIGVNSYHHQGIKKLGDNLDVMAYASDGLVEAIRLKDKNFIVGVQWHPEFSYHNDENSYLIAKAFINAIK